MNIFKEIFHSRLMMRLGIDKYLPQIIFALICCICYIWFSTQLEITLKAQEKNKATVEYLESLYTEYECELTSLNSVAKTTEILSGHNSKLDIPKKRATIIE